MTQKKRVLFLSRRDPGLRELIKIYKDMETAEGRVAILSEARHIARIEPGLYDTLKRRFDTALDKLRREYEGEGG